MSFLDHLNESALNIDDLFESVEIIDEAMLEEAINKFNDLPAAWKKLTTSGRNAGENSEIEVKSTGRIKNKTALNKLLKQSLTDAEENAGVIIEIDGNPIMMVLQYYRDKKYRVVLNDGNMKKVIKSRWDRGTRYSAGRMYTWQESDMRIQETIDAINDTLRRIANIKINNAEDDESKHTSNTSIEDTIAVLDITFKVLHRDAQRQAKQGERRDAKSDRDDFKNNARAVIKKFTAEHVSGLVDEIKEQLPKISDVEELLNRAANGEKVVFDVKGIEERIKRLNRVLYYFEDAHKDGKVKDKSWNGQSAKLSWDMKQLVSILKGKD